MTWNVKIEKSKMIPTNAIGFCKWSFGLAKFIESIILDTKPDKILREQQTYRSEIFGKFQLGGLDFVLPILW